MEREVILSGTADCRLELPRLPALLLPDFLGSSADYNMVTGLSVCPLACLASRARASRAPSGFLSPGSRESEQDFLGRRSLNRSLIRAKDSIRASDKNLRDCCRRAVVTIITLIADVINDSQMLAVDRCTDLQSIFNHYYIHSAFRAGWMTDAACR